MERYTSGHYEAAVHEFSRFRSRWPEHASAPEALFLQAGSALGAGHDAEAIDLFANFRDRYPSHPLASEARLTLGTYFYETGDYGRAIETLETVAAEELTEEAAAKALYWMGESALAQGSFDRAIGYFRDAAERYPDTETAPVARYAIAFNHVERGHYAEAARSFELLSARYPKSPYVESMGLALAEAYYEIGEYERVIPEIDRRINRLRGGARERATFLLAEAYNHLRNSEEAIVYYRRFTEDNPDSPFYRHAVYGLAWNYHREEVYQWAAEQFDVVQRDASDDLAHRARYYQGVNLALAVQYERAAEAYEDVIRRWPDGPLTGPATFELGMARYHLRQWQASADAFEVFVENYKDSERYGEANRMLGEALVAVGNFDRAFIAYDEALEAKAAPKSLRDQVQFQKAWLLYRNGDFDEAGPAFIALYRQDTEGEQAGDALFWAAESYYQTGTFQRAASLFTQYLKEFPSHRQVAAAHYALGWTYFRQGQYTGSAMEFGRFLNQYRGDANLLLYARDARLRLADSYYALKQYGDAIRAYRRVEGDERDYALFQIGQAQSNAGRNQDAIATFQQLQEDHEYSPYREEAMYATGYLKFLEQDYEGAIEEYEKVVRRFPEKDVAARAQYGIADAHYNAEDWEEAELAYRRVLADYPESELVIDAVGGVQYALLAQDREDEVDAVVDSFAVHHPDSPILDELRLRQAELKYRDGRLEEALAGFEQFVAGVTRRDLLPDAYLYIGRIRSDLNQSSEAAVYLRKVVDEYPNHPLSLEASQRLGLILLDEDRYGDALRLYRSLGDKAGRNEVMKSESLYGEGMALLGLGRSQDAEDLFNKVLAEQPSAYEEVRALLGLARVYDVTGRPAEATSHYRLVVRQSQGEPGAEALCRLGELLIQTGQPSEALVELGRLPVLYSNYPQWEARGYLAQARAHLALNQKSEADRILELVVTRYPGTRYAEMAAREQRVL
jgi:TolA-binding protein